MRAFCTLCIRTIAISIFASGQALADPAARVAADPNANPATTAQATLCSAAQRTEDACQPATSYQQRADEAEGAVRNALQRTADTKARHCREQSDATAATDVSCRVEVAAQDIPSGQGLRGLRVGTALGLIVGYFQSDSGRPIGVGGIMTQVQLGEQPSPRAAVYLRGELGMGLFTFRAGLHLVGEWSPARWFSIGSGLGYDGWNTEYSSWWAVSVPVIASIVFLRHDHNALRFSVDATGGVEPSTGLFGGRGGVALGWVLD